jgi:hypothetical protein
MRTFGPDDSIEDQIGTSYASRSNGSPIVPLRRQLLVFEKIDFFEIVSESDYELPRGALVEAA